MDTPRTISKTNASFPKHLSFKELRQQGIAHCQALAGDLWTDYNLHDPGLSILEVLCFALTDLGYRTNLPIEDLLARDPKRASAGDYPDDNFFTPEQILTCNPVTLLDLRKLLIDIPGVRNAWIEPAGDAEVPLYFNHRTNALELTGTDHPLAHGAATDADRVRLEGLYRVLIELDGDEEADPCGSAAAQPTATLHGGTPGISVERILGDVRRTLHAHRNLCEDFLDLVILGVEEVALCADLDIDPGASAEDVLYEVTRRLDAFLSPVPTFYTLQELLARGRSIEEIYAGRPAAPLSHLAAAVTGCGDDLGASHGFIDTEELAAIERRTELHLSDIYREVMVVPGVLAIRNLLAVNYINAIPKTDGERWCLGLTPGHRQRFSLARSRLTLSKGLLSFGSRDFEVRVAQRIEETRAASTKAPLAEHQLDRRVPAGKYRPLADYRSIVHELPLLYGVGEGGLPDGASAQRRVQAKQLRAYLLFYDQILAAYLAQLANLRALFSFRPESGPGGRRTYFTQPLGDKPRERDASPGIGELPGIDELLERFNDCPGAADDPGAAEDYPDYLARLTEDPETYQDRRNRFLDHLLARFAESFTDYVLLTFDISGDRYDPEWIIRDKVEMLQTYPWTSRNRGKAFDYTSPVIWDTRNLSGLEHRVARLLGIRDPDCAAPVADQANPGDALAELPYRRRTLGPIEVIETPGAWHWLLDATDTGLDFGMRSRQGWPGRDAAGAALAAFRASAGTEAAVLRLTYRGAEADAFGIAVLGADDKLLAEADRTWPQAEARDLQRARLIALAIGGGVQIALEQAEECFFNQLLDDDGVVLLAAVHGQATEAEAFAAYTGTLLPAASDHTRYRDVDDLPNGLPHAEIGFGFELLERPDGELLARHPHCYATARERTLRKRIVLYTLCHPEIRLGAAGTPGTYTLEVLDASGKTLFRGAASYPSRAAAGIAYHALLRRAQLRPAYRLLDVGEEREGFGFELLDDHGELLAHHPTRYPSAAQRNLALEAIIGHVCSADMRYSIAGNPGCLHGLVLDPDGAELLCTVATETTEAGAIEAAAALIPLGRDPCHWCLLDGPDGYGLALRGATDLAATHGQCYATVAERDAAIAMIIAYLSAPEPQHRIINPTGAFRFELRDGDGVPVLAGTEIFSNAGLAEAAACQAITLARGRAHWQPTEQGPEGCRFGFEIRAPDAGAIAQAPHPFSDVAGRDAAMHRLYALVHRLDTIPDLLDPEFGQAFVIRDHEGTAILIGNAAFKTAAEAEAAFAEAVAEAARPDALVPLQQGCRYGFALRDGKRELARHPHTYPSILERDIALLAARFTLRSGGTPYRIEALGDGRQAFLYLDADGTGALLAEVPAADLRGALALLIDSHPRAIDPTAYAPAEGPASDNRFGFRLLRADGSTLATHPGGWPSAQARDAALGAWVSWLGGRLLQPALVPAPLRYFWRLSDLDGAQLLRSTAHWPTEAAALDAFRGAMGPVADGSTSLQPIYDNAACPNGEPYSFELRAPGSEAPPCRQSPGKLLATHGRHWSRASDRDQRLEQALALVRPQVVQQIALGVPCGHRFVLTNQTQALVACTYYPSPAGAALAGTRLLRHLGDPEHYRIESAPGGGQRLVASSGDGQIEAVSPPADAETLVAMREALIAAALDLEPLAHRLVERPSGVQCRLSDAAGDWLLADAGGPSAGVHAGMTGLPDRSSRDDAMAQTRERFATAPPAPRIEGSEGAYRYAFDIDSAAGLVLRGRWSHGTEAEAIAAAGTLLGLPQGRDPLPADPANYRLLAQDTAGYGFEIVDRVAAAAGRRSACKTCNRLAEQAQEADAFQWVEAEDVCLHGFRLLDPNGSPLTAIASLWADAGECQRRIEQIRCLVGAEGFHLVEHLLLRPRESGPQETDSPGETPCPAHDAAGPGLIPLGGGCRGADDALCPPTVDPYSFRISLVLPYWPKRFRHRDFRPFFERTLRLETPAHIFPRICWVDCCQMRAFETAYRRWLSALASPGGDCDLVSAQAELIDVLFGLTSVYEPGHLSDCGATTGDNPVILDRTILGTAGTDHGNSPQTLA